MAAPLITVVNDDSAFLQLMYDVLTDEGYPVALHFTTEGLAGVIAGQQPALVILDIVMGQRDAGLQLLAQLRADPALRDLPVIVSSADLAFLTAHADALATLRCVVLPKPFDLDDLLGRIAHLLPPVSDAQAG